MRQRKAFNKLTNQIIASDVTIADNFLRRLLGWIGHSPREGEAMIFPDCSAIHTWFMRTRIDLLFVDENGCVISAETISAWRVALCHKAAKAIELPEGTIKKYGIKPGNCLDTFF